MLNAVLDYVYTCMILCCRYRLSGGGGSSSEEDEAYDKRERDLFGAKTNTSEHYYYMSLVTQWSTIINSVRATDPANIL